MPAAYTVVTTDYTFPVFDNYTAELSGLPVRFVPAHCETEEDLLAAARDADGLIHEHFMITRAVIDGLDRCRVIAHHGKGVDNIDVAAATARGICVANVLDASVHEVSEHLFALLLAVARRLPAYDHAVRAGRWDVQVGEPVYRLHGKTMGLIGFGNLARYAAAKARAFGMRVVAWARRPSEALAAEHEVTFVPLPQLFSEADVVSVHLPVTPETYGIVSRELISRMRPTGIFLNISRGALVDEAALAEALVSGRILGAGLDVLREEPPPRDHPLLGLDRVVLTPHAAWYSEEGRADVERRTAREVARVLRGEWPASWVNPEARDAFLKRFGGGQP